MTVAIIDYGSGNLHSARKAFERAAATLDAPPAVALTSDPDVVRRAERIVLPGVGAFADCMRGLDGVPGMREALEDAARRDAKPFLGICVGMQLLATRGLEHFETAGLGWIPGDVAALRPSDPTLKIPHMGWNTIAARRPHALLASIPTGPDGLHAYFVHSYQLYAAEPDHVAATADYGGPVTAIVASGNIAGTQFHPEKSQALGLALIANFLRWMP